MGVVGAVVVADTEVVMAADMADIVPLPVIVPRFIARRFTLRRATGPRAIGPLATGKWPG
jgi:hypothetical protein